MILLIPEAEGRSHTFRVPGWLARRYRAVLGAAVLGVLLLGATWVHFVLQAGRVAGLEEEVARLTTENRRVAQLAAEVEALDEAYGRIRALFGSSETPGADELWLPPGTGSGGGIQSSTSNVGGTPTEWPLAERGFVTREPMTSGGDANHPGLDIAVPSGVYILAAGGGWVREAGTDETYGHYIVLDHGEGYRTLYGHASVLLVAEGDTVRGREVIALTGSTGQSTAPHLHFEITNDGEAIDPLSLLSQP